MIFFKKDAIIICCLDFRRKKRKKRKKKRKKRRKRKKRKKRKKKRKKKKSKKRKSSKVAEFVFHLGRDLPPPACSLPHTPDTAM